MPEVVWTRAAESDLQAVYNELESFDEGLGDNFLSLVDSSIELLKQFPAMAPIYAFPFHRLRLRDRKHGLFYTIEPRGIILHAITDLRRDPEELRLRFRKLLE